MDTDQLIASLVSSLAWPAVVVGLAVVFRRPIRQLLTARPLKRLKAGPLEFEWDRVTAEVETKLDMPPVRESQREPGHPRVLLETRYAEGRVWEDREPEPSTLVEELASIAETSPPAAILQAFSRVAQDLEARLRARGFEQTDHRWGPLGLARRANAGGLITPQALESVEGVAILRNLAANRPKEVTKEQALDYLALVDAVLFTLRTGGKN